MKKLSKNIAITIIFGILMSTAAVLAKKTINSGDIDIELIFSAGSRVIVFLILVAVFGLPLTEPFKIRPGATYLLPFIIPLSVCLLAVGANVDKFTSVPPGRLALFILAMTCVAFLEEYVFRRIIFSRLSQGEASVYRAALISALLFGGVHLVNAFLFEQRPLGYTLSQMIFAMTIGIFFCGLYYRTGNFAGVVLLHALINISFGTNRLTQSVLSPPPVAGGDGTSLASLIFTLVIYALIAASGVYMIHLEDKRRTEPPGDGAGTQFRSQ